MPVQDSIDFDMPIGVEPQPLRLTGPQKAAILVRMLAGDEMPITLHDLPEEMQLDLVREIGRLGQVDPATLEAVAEEFIQLLEGGGLMGRMDLGRTLDLLGSAISPEVAEELRAGPGGRPRKIEDPWETIGAREAEELAPLFEAESVEVAAVALAKLNVSKAAQILGLMPGERARRISYAVSLTSGVRPDAVRRIGQALAGALSVERVSAFSDSPVERVGAILNFSRASRRDEVLEGLIQEDKTFAEEVKKAIFTFGNIPDRVAPSDIPKVLRRVEQADLVKALVGAKAGGQENVVEFILGAMSKRMAEGLRGEMDDLGGIDDAAGEEAMTAVVAAIREMEAEGEIFLIVKDE